MKKLLSSIMMLATMMAAMTSLSSCEDEDDYIAQKLREGDWQGYIDTYYSSRWSLSGSTYETVMHFESRGEYYTSGRGCELDYDTRSPYNDYAYCTFSWCIVERNVILIYDDSQWNTTWIREYRLTNTNFYGFIDDGSGRNIKFDLENITAYGDWGRYGSVYDQRNYGYGGFEHQNWFRSRSTIQNDNEVPFLDRTDFARENSGEAEAVSVASGEFAKAMMRSEK